MGKSTYHPFVECYHKAKDGYLWLFPDGIFYGVKKPLLWIPLCKVASWNIVNNGRFKIDLEVNIQDPGLSDSAETLKLRFDLIDAIEADPITEFMEQQCPKNVQCVTNSITVKSSQQFESILSMKLPSHGEVSDDDPSFEHSDQESSSSGSELSEPDETSE
jgi:hypothetical protein